MLAILLNIILTRIVDLDDLGTVTLAGLATHGYDDMTILFLVSKVIAGAAITTAAATTTTTTTTEYTHQLLELVYVAM